MSLKSLIVRYIPDSLLNALKRVHYLRALKKSYEDKEQDLIVVKRLVRPGDCAVVSEQILECIQESIRRSWGLKDCPQVISDSRDKGSP